MRRLFNSALVGTVASQDPDYTQKALLDMESYFQESGFTEKYYGKLNSCFDQYDDKLLRYSQEKAWQGYFEYAWSNGTNNDTRGKPDHWEDCVGSTDPDCAYSEYQETIQNKSGFMGHDKPYYVVEPCNYASNIAYYHSALKVCDYPNWQENTRQKGFINDLKRGFATLATGSAFFHGSMTYVGKRFDNDLIAMIAFQSYQMMVQKLRTNSSVIHELSEQPRAQSSFQIMSNITEYIAYKKQVDWVTVLIESDFPREYYVTFAAQVTFILAMLLPFWFVDKFVTFLCDNILPQESRDFIVNSYLPELSQAIDGIVVEHSHRILEAFIGMLIKIIYAFSYQEHKIPIKFNITTMGKFIGGTSIPYMNAVADWFTRFPQTDSDVNKSTIYVYPGQGFCKINEAHAVWHEVSANGLLDLVYVCDLVNGFIHY